MKNNSGGHDTSSLCFHTEVFALPY